MATNVVLGPTAKIDLGYLVAGGSASLLTPLRVLTGSIDDDMEPTKVTDTDTPNGCDEFFPKVYGHAMVQLSGQLDLDGTNASSLMFMRPLLLVPGRTVQMIIWPQGRNSGVMNSYWKFYRLLLGKGTHAFAVQSSLPQRFTITGISSWYYKRPFEIDLGGPTTPPAAEVLLALSNRTI